MLRLRTSNSSSLLFLFRILFVFSVSIIAPWRAAHIKPASSLFLPAFWIQMCIPPDSSLSGCFSPHIIHVNTRSRQHTALNTCCCRHSKGYLVIVLAKLLNYCQRCLLPDQKHIAFVLISLWRLITKSTPSTHWRQMRPLSLQILCRWCRHSNISCCFNVRLLLIFQRYLDSEPDLTHLFAGILGFLDTQLSLHAWKGLLTKR